MGDTVKGPELLQKYLTDQKVSCLAFALRNRLNPGQVRTMLRGERQRVSVDLAVAIETATGGAVPWHAWLRTEGKEQNGEGETKQE